MASRNQNRRRQITPVDVDLTKGQRWFIGYLFGSAEGTNKEGALFAAELMDALGIEEGMKRPERDEAGEPEDEIYQLTPRQLKWLRTLLNDVSEAKRIPLIWSRDVNAVETLLNRLIDGQPDEAEEEGEAEVVDEQA